MLNALGRVFVDDLSLCPTHTFHQIIPATPRISVHVYRDDPFYLTIFHLDGRAVLKEVMVSDLWGYTWSTKEDRNLHTFIIDYGAALLGGC